VARPIDGSARRSEEERSVRRWRCDGERSGARCEEQALVCEGDGVHDFKAEGMGRWQQL
jgi:hypothetical protein